MSRIKESELYIYTEDNENFESYDNQMALFKTKIVSDMKHNGEIVEVIGLLKGKDIYNDRYIVRFNDGSIDNNIMSVELDFDYKKEIERKTNQKNKERSKKSSGAGRARCAAKYFAVSAASVGGPAGGTGRIDPVWNFKRDAGTFCFSRCAVHHGNALVELFAPLQFPLQHRVRAAGLFFCVRFNPCGNGQAGSFADTARQ